MTRPGRGPAGDDAGDIDDERDGVEVLAEEFVARRRRGEAVEIDEYVGRHPGLADEIRALFPTIAAMERYKPPATQPRPRIPAPAPERLGECRIVREIGRGGMGIVYEAEQESLGRRVAVKVLSYPSAADDRSTLRFLREARTAGGLLHPRIVPVFGVGEDRGHVYYIMPLIDGVGLDRILHRIRRGPESLSAATEIDRWAAESIARTLLDPATSSAATHHADLAPPRADDAPWSRPGPAYWRSVATIGQQAAEAIEFAHEKGILHRDIKPANLLIDQAGAAWVADFGLAKAVEHDDLSRSGDFVGTLRYMAPERFRGQCDRRSDVYSLGLTLYEMLTLRPAFEAAERATLMRRIAATEPPRPRDRFPDIPADLETIVLKAIATDPADRYPTAADLAADLGRYLAGMPIRARPASLLGQVVRWVGLNPVLAGLSVATLVLGAIAAFFFALWLFAPPHDRPEPPPERRPGAAKGRRAAAPAVAPGRLGRPEA